MSHLISAIYEHGLLRPLEALHLQECQKVKIQVLQESNNSEQIIEFLVNLGWLTPPSKHSNIRTITPAERLRVAEILGKSIKRPVSEMIIEDRGEW
jgi:predicted DNA-binding antitoxin AbrB/MazE fold protein